MTSASTSNARPNAPMGTRHARFLPADAIAWLVNHGRHLATPAELLEGLAECLNAAGLEVLRLNLHIRALHPDVQLLLAIWRRHEQAMVLSSAARIVAHADARTRSGYVQQVSLGHGSFDAPAFKVSPLWPVYMSGQPVRCRIRRTQRTFEYPILKDLQALGATDYLAVPLRFHDHIGGGFTIATSRKGGFSPSILAGLQALMGTLTLCTEMFSQRHVLQSLMATYLGREPSERVLAGHIQRGDVETVQAAIWFSDLRGFTSTSEALGPVELIGWLNRYFGVIAGPIYRHGGEILKFIGDAVLAVFPVGADRDEARACQDALHAAREANAELDAFNATANQSGARPVAHGIGLHFGAAQYGNIGAERRLDFTVIGPAVNVAARVEALCSKTGQRALASAAVARHAAEPLVELGHFELKGVGAAVAVFAVR